MKGLKKQKEDTTKKNKIRLSLESQINLETYDVSLFEEWKSIKIYLTRRLLHLRSAVDTAGFPEQQVQKHSV